LIVKPVAVSKSTKVSRRHFGNTFTEISTDSGVNRRLARGAWVKGMTASEEGISKDIKDYEIWVTWFVLDF